ncbi:MAG TPA: TolC family protein [Drouetiella sp.]
MTNLRDLILRNMLASGSSLLVLALGSTNASAADKQQLNAQIDESVIARVPPTRTLSLEKCLLSADQYNREILSARWNVITAQAAIKIASAIPNPQPYIQTGFANSFRFLFTGQTSQYGLTEDIQTAGKRTKKIEVAKANYKLAEIQLDALRFDVHNRVRRAYAELAASEAYDDLIESQRAVGERLLTIAQKRFDAGKAAKAEVLQANLNVLQYDTQRNSAQGRLQRASASLSLITGERPSRVEVLDVDDNGLFKLSTDKSTIVPPYMQSLPAVSDLIGLALTERIDLKAAQQQVYANQRALTLSKAMRIPDVVLGGGGTFSTFAKNQPSGLSPAGNWLGTGAYFTLSMEQPFFYQHQGEVQQAAATVRVSQAQLSLLKSQVTTATIFAYSELSVARANVFEYQQNLLPTAAQVAKIARRGYEVGATDLATAIVAQQQYQQTLSSYFDTVVNYQNAWADVEQAVGVPVHL